MRVKLCARCPYTPQDLASHYDPEAALHACAKCDREQEVTAKHYPREAYRRRRCSTVPNITGIAQQSAAPSVTESSVSSGTTHGEQPSVQEGALIASRLVKRATAGGYADFEPLDNSRNNNRAELSFRPGCRNKEAAQ
jgi:hypothetical protein